MEHDNKTLSDKLRIRRRVLDRLTAPPVVLETHGGFGRIYERTWYRARTGVVIEKDPVKVAHLCHQRPTWAVYQGNSEAVLRAGLAKSIAFDVIDLDPYGQPFTILDALTMPGRTFPNEWHLVVNDGGRNLMKRGLSWKLPMFRSAEKRFGQSGMHKHYLDAALMLVQEFGEKIGYDVTHWHGKNISADISHYWAVLKRRGAE